MSLGSSRRAPTSPRTWPVVLVLGLFLALSLALIAIRPAWAPWIGLVDGLVVGIGLGAGGLVRSYDDSWDEFFETVALTYFLGFLALFVYLFRRETPSAFFWIEFTAGLIGYAMLLFVPLTTWLVADLLLFGGTFFGWFFSGLFGPDPL